jgi:hypothetical protein
MSVHYIIQKTLITNKYTQSFFINCKYTLLHVSTLLGHLQEETFRCLYTKLHYTVKRGCAVVCTQAETKKSSRLHKRRSEQSTAHSRLTV